jgi:PTH1 family peptidyl-tRNA hydrolase
MFYAIGLGNPGEEYESTRHNTGREAVMRLAKDLKAEDFEFNKKSNAQVSKIKIGKEPATLVLPDTFMNKSGNAVSYFVKPKPKASKKGLDNLIVVHDDLDLPLGKMKISYNKGVGGHRGLDSVVKAVKTLEFVRVRVGVSPATAKGLAKKPGTNMTPKAAEKAVIDFILGKWKPKEQDVIKKEFKKASEAIQTLATDGRDRAMNQFNQ